MLRTSSPSPFTSRAALPQQGRFGTLGRNTFRGPPFTIATLPSSRARVRNAARAERTGEPAIPQRVLQPLQHRHMGLPPTSSRVPASRISKTPELCQIPALAQADLLSPNATLGKGCVDEGECNRVSAPNANQHGHRLPGLLAPWIDTLGLAGASH